MLIRAYSFITNKMMRTFNMVLYDELITPIEILKKYTDILHTLTSKRLQKICY